MCASSSTMVSSGQWLYATLEEDDAETGSLHLGKAGQVKIKKARVETSNPANMEEFRAKVDLMINHLIFARFRYPHKACLDDLTPFTSIEYLRYICSKNVAQLESLAVDDVTLHRPSLKLIMSYEYQTRKEAVEQVNKGDAWATSFKSVVKNADYAVDQGRLEQTTEMVRSAASLRRAAEGKRQGQSKGQERLKRPAERQRVALPRLEQQGRGVFGIMQ